MDEGPNISRKTWPVDPATYPLHGRMRGPVYYPTRAIYPRGWTLFAIGACCVAGALAAFLAIERLFYR